MKTAILAVSLLVGGIPIAFSDFVYDIDYEPPTYTNGQQIGGGSTETISDSISGFSSQGLLIHDGGGISYITSEAFTTGVHLVSWNFAVPISQGSSQIINAQVGGQSQSVFFDTTLSISGSGNEIRYGDPFPTPRPSIPFNIGQSYSFAVTVNLDANYYSFSVDGVLLEDTISIPQDTYLDVVSFGQNQTLGLQAGIDNFRWEVVPEPATLALLLLGGAALCLARRSQQVARE